jgi:hypothetical protein
MPTIVGTFGRPFHKYIWQRLYRFCNIFNILGGNRIEPSLVQADFSLPGISPHKIFQQPIDFIYSGDDLYKFLIRDFLSSMIARPKLLH